MQDMIRVIPFKARIVLHQASCYNRNEHMLLA